MMGKTGKATTQFLCHAKAERGVLGLDKAAEITGTQVSKGNPLPSIPALKMSHEHRKSFRSLFGHLSKFVNCIHLMDLEDRVASPTSSKPTLTGITVSTRTTC